MDARALMAGRIWHMVGTIRHPPSASRFSAMGGGERFQFQLCGHGG
jgi:hypothetical protein